eukprot:658458-Pyramimonas_sp.AAC.1
MNKHALEARLVGRGAPTGRSPPSSGILPAQCGGGDARWWPLSGARARAATHIGARSARRHTHRKVGR